MPNCYPSDIPTFLQNYIQGTVVLNNAYRTVGIYFNGTAWVVPCTSPTSGITYLNVTSWNDVQNFHNDYTTNFRSFREAVIRSAGAYNGYSGVHLVQGVYGWYSPSYLNSINTVPHEIGHGLGNFLFTKVCYSKINTLKKVLSKILIHNMVT